MAVDQGLVGRMAAELMEQLEDAYSDDAVITAALLIVNVDSGDGRDTVHFKPSPGLARYEGVGMVEYAKHNFLIGQV